MLFISPKKIFSFSRYSNFCIFKKNFMASFYGWGSIASRLQSHYGEVVYFLPLSSQKFLVLIWSILEGQKAESTLEPFNGFEHGIPGWESSTLTTRSLAHITRMTYMTYMTPITYITLGTYSSTSPFFPVDCCFRGWLNKTFCLIFWEGKKVWHCNFISW